MASILKNWDVQKIRNASVNQAIDGRNDDLNNF